MGMCVSFGLEAHLSTNENVTPFPSKDYNNTNILKSEQHPSPSYTLVWASLVCS